MPLSANWAWSFADVPVRSDLPKVWTPKDGPAITVAGNGTTNQNDAWTGEIVRIVVHAEYAPDAHGFGGEGGGVSIGSPIPSGVHRQPCYGAECRSGFPG